MNLTPVDPSWEADVYSQGRHLNRYPYDHIVSFIFRWSPKDRPRKSIRLLELGCGAGNNLWFTAREGFSSAGIDGSPTAIEIAKRRLHTESLDAELCVGSFESLPWPDASFDLAFERGALVCGNLSSQRNAINETHRVLKPGGIFLYNGFTDRHTSAAAGVPQDDGRIAAITDGTLANSGSYFFTSRRDVDDLFGFGWRIEHRELMEIENHTLPRLSRHSEWRVVARKI